MIPFDFDFRNPDYRLVYAHRVERLNRIRANPSCLPALYEFYKNNPAQFITDWGMTYDPRNVERGLPPSIPFILFERQEEWINEVVECWKSQTNLITEKSRDMGVSWLAVALSVTLSLFNRGMAIGVGSRKQDYVDKIGDSTSLLEKVRLFIEHLPVEFRGSWNRNKNSKLLTISFDNGSIITGEAGKNIGRGGRNGIYITDEEAFFEQADLIEAALSQNTNCRISISTPNSMANPFAQKRFSGKYKVFSFHWTQDPRKNDEWYQKQVNTLDPVILAQEVNIDYKASVEGIVIPSEWIQSALDAHIKLNIEPTGQTFAALDLADEGKDKNAFVVFSKGVLSYAEEWSGKGSDIFSTVERAITLCDQFGVDYVKYDADGLGAGVRGDANQINQLRLQNGLREIKFIAYRGGSSVAKPESAYIRDATGSRIMNKDFFVNYKAQSYWNMRELFLNTHRAVQSGEVKGAVISISSQIPSSARLQLMNELSQPTWDKDVTGKILINKKPNGAMSPNFADAASMICAVGK